jgi:menaquinone-9 beta-reductase
LGQSTPAFVQVLGGGPAGSAAALAALAESVPVRIAERSRLPRHKVCGEFLSPGAPEALERLGVWQDFLKLGPAPIRRLVLRAGRAEKRWLLPECGFGISRYRFDLLLYEKAVSAGAVPGLASAPGAVVAASGRKAVQPRGGRLFGFKAHFSGPAGDAVELFFCRGWYAGVSPVEGGLTNVCGLAPEELLASRRFQFDDLVCAAGPLAERLRPLSRAMPWMASGPVSFSGCPTAAPGPRQYPAGDALGFVDPFTGTGILNALLTGRLAGIAAARGLPAADYLAECRRALGGAFRVAGAMRSLLAVPYAGDLARLLPARLLPARLLFRLTRPVMPEVSRLLRPPRR